MKLLFLLIISTFSMNVFANCSDKLWSSYRWSNARDMTEIIKSCIVNSESFQNSLNGLVCSSNKDSISDEYGTYLEYKSQFEVKLAERDATENKATRRFLDSDLRSIRNEWIALGYKYEIENELFLAFKADKNCLEENKTVAFDF